VSRGMHDIITRLLSKWLERYYDDQDPLNDDEERDWWLDHHLMGVALFLKQVACESEDMELLGFAAKVEMILAEHFQREKEEWKADEEMREAQMEEMKRPDPVEERCRLYLQDPSFLVDVSRYHDLIDAAKIEDRKVLFGLYKYLDERKVLKNIKSAVISTFVYHHHLKSPDDIGLDDIRREFDRRLTDFYRRADKTVADRIAKALRDEGRDEPAAPRLPAPNFLVPDEEG
jgi:hypothetical protein